MVTTTAIQNKHLVRRETAELQKRNYDIVDKLYADDADIKLRRTGSDGPVTTRDDLKALYREWGQAFPDLTIEVVAEAAEGDTVIQQVKMRGTHEGTFRGIEPTGRVVEVNGFQRRRFEDGQIVEASSVVGMGSLAEQLGHQLPFEA